MAARAPQYSATSLARYATARQADVDVFNGSKSRDYCNSFWGTGDAGPNIMFARMRGASKTTDELRNYWNERCVQFTWSHTHAVDYPSKDALLRRNMRRDLQNWRRLPLEVMKLGELRIPFNACRNANSLLQRTA